MTDEREVVVNFNNNNFPKKKEVIFLSKKKNSGWLTSEMLTLICVLNASFGLFSNGAFVGWSSYAMDFFPVTFSAQQNMRIFSIVALAAAISPLIIHKIWHFIGTKRFILISYFLMILSWVLATFSDNYWYLLTGRIIGGMAVGALHFLIPMYINDISVCEQKPLYHSIIQLQFVLGILSQYILRLFESFTVISLLPAIICGVLLITFLFMPESPRFLSARGETDRAKEILLNFKSIDRDVEIDLQLWASQNHKRGYLAAFKEDFGIQYALPVFGVFMFEQLIGAISILFYMQKILKLTEGEFSPEVMAIICCIVFGGSTLIPHAFKIRSITIKSSLMWSSNLMAISLCVLGGYCHYQGSFGGDYIEDYRHIPLICLALFFFFFAIGPYRLSNEYAEQIIPKKCYFTIRCLLTSTSWCLIYVITRMLPRLIDIIGVGWLFWYMAMMCMFMSLFIKLFVPDLKKLPEEFRLVDSSESYSEA